MTFLKKILGGLVFVFFVMPACIATIAAIQLQLTAPSNIMYLFGFAAAWFLQGRQPPTRWIRRLGRRVRELALRPRSAPAA